MGGFTNIPKLKIEDLGNENTGDRIALFNSVGELVGYQMAGSGGGGGAFLPLSGTEVGSPITGDVEFSNNNKLKYEGPEAFQSLYFSEDDFFIIRIEEKDPYEGGNADYSFQSDGLFINNTLSESIGITSNSFYNKQNNPKTFAQLGDMATTNEAVTPLSLATLNSTYPTQGTGFKVICPEIDIIYVKSSLTTWKNLNTNQSIVNNSYSTTESLTGGTWIDGKPIYRKVITGDNSLTNDFLISSDLETICNSSGTHGTGSSIKPFPYFSIYETTGGTVTETEIYYEFSGTSKPTTLRVYSHSRATTGSGGTITSNTINFKIIIEYTKTTDPTP